MDVRITTVATSTAVAAEPAATGVTSRPPPYESVDLKR